MTFEPHGLDSWITKRDDAIEYMIRRTCGTCYVYHYARYVGAATDYPAAEKLARNDDARIKAAAVKA